MIRLSRWKVVLCIVSAVFGLLFTLPNLVPAGTLPGWMPSKKLNLGLDLQGGSYLLLEVDTAAIKVERLNNLTEDVRTTLRENRIGFSDLGLKGQEVDLTITDPTKLDAARTELSKLGNALQGGGRDVLVAVHGQQLSLSLSEQAMTEDAVQAVKQEIEIIRRRVDQLGTREPSIVQQGKDRIVVEAPGESDPERLKSVIGQTAKLTFQMVDDTVSADDMAAGRVPPGSVIVPSEERQETQLALKRRILVAGEMLVSASPGYDQYNRPSINFRFNGQGARRFADATAQNVGKRFAIVLDNKIISAPTIQEPITGGSGQITGNFTLQEANDLALLLRSGALPAPLKVQEQRTVGAELGAGRDPGWSDLHRSRRGGDLRVHRPGLRAVRLVRGVGPGGQRTADRGADVDYPGDAHLARHRGPDPDPGRGGGRQRADLRAHARRGARRDARPIAAMDAGYSRAMSTIIDANLTTLIAALIMFSVRLRSRARLRLDLVHRHADLDVHRRPDHPGADRLVVPGGAAQDPADLVRRR